jgi:hypothetical protein
MLIELILKLITLCFTLIGYIAYYTLKGLLLFLKYAYRKLKESRRGAPSLMRYDKDTNDLEVLK